MGDVERADSTVMDVHMEICTGCNQVVAWENPVQDLVESFGRNPATVPALLQFLTILPEELNSNMRIPISVSSV